MTEQLQTIPSLVPASVPQCCSMMTPRQTTVFTAFAAKLLLGDCHFLPSRHKGKHCIGSMDFSHVELLQTPFWLAWLVHTFTVLHWHLAKNSITPAHFQVCKEAFCSWKPSFFQVLHVCQKKWHMYHVLDPTVQKTTVITLLKVLGHHGIVSLCSASKISKRYFSATSYQKH